MTEIRVPVTTPGATQAASELRGVRAAAESVGKAEENLAKSNARLAQSSRAAATATKSEAQAFLEKSRALAQAARAQQASGRAGQGFLALGRSGGMAGGVLGRIGSSLGSPSLGSFGPLAAGAAVAGLGLMKLAEVSQYNVERATALAKSIVDLQESIDGARKTAGANRVSAFNENNQVIRQLVAAGVPLSRVQGLARQGYTDAPEALSAQASNYSDGDKVGGTGAVAMRVAQTLVRLGVTSNLMEGLKQLPEDRVRNAIAGGGNSTQLLREIIGESRGGAPISADTLAGMLQRTRYSPEVMQLDRTASAAGDFRGVRVDAASDPAAATSIMNERAAWIDPVTAAIGDTNAKMERQLEVLEKAAEAQSAVMRMLANVSSPSGSLRVQVIRAREDFATTVGSVQ